MSKHGLRLSTRKFRNSRDGHAGSTLVEIRPDHARSATEFSRRMMESTATLLLSANARRSSEKPRPLSQRNTPSTGLSFSSVRGKKVPYITLVRLRIVSRKAVLTPGQNLTARPPLVEKNCNPGHKSKNPQLEKASLLDNVTLGPSILECSHGQETSDPQLCR